MEATSTNVSALLVVALACAAVFFILRKRYDSNLPLLFYFVALVFTNMSSFEINPYLLYVGLVFALLLRFEFMNSGFSKLIGFLATGSMGLIIYVMLAEVFGDGSSPF